MMWGLDASKLTDSELEKALALPDERPAPSPEQTTEAIIVSHIYGNMMALSAYPESGIKTAKTLGDDQP